MIEPFSLNEEHIMAIRNVLAISKEGGGQYVFLFDDESVPALSELLEEFAERPELDFNHKDARTLLLQLEAPDIEEGVELRI